MELICPVRNRFIQVSQGIIEQSIRPETGTACRRAAIRSLNLSRTARNIRRVFVDYPTTPVTFRIGNNHGASIVRLDPLVQSEPIRPPTGSA